MINLNEGSLPSGTRNYSDGKPHGTMTNRVGNTMGSLDYSPL
jgi:hypothetical protein